MGRSGIISAKSRVLMGTKIKIEVLELQSLIYDRSLCDTILLHEIVCDLVVDAICQWRLVDISGFAWLVHNLDKSLLLASNDLLFSVGGIDAHMLAIWECYTDRLQLLELFFERERRRVRSYV